MSIYNYLHDMGYKRKHLDFHIKLSFQPNFSVRDAQEFSSESEHQLLCLFFWDIFMMSDFLENVFFPAKEFWHRNVRIESGESKIISFE